MSPSDADTHTGTEAGDEPNCPECDAVADWQVSSRHRFSPFGSVLLIVLAFWSAVLGWLMGFGYLPSFALLAVAVGIGSATRKAETCTNCGYVRPLGH